MVTLAGVAKTVEGNRRRVAGVLSSRSAISRPGCGREVNGALPITQYCASSTSNLKHIPTTHKWTAFTPGLAY
jgi:hypothetical protein